MLTHAKCYVHNPHWMWCALSRSSFNQLNEGRQFSLQYNQMCQRDKYFFFLRRRRRRIVWIKWYGQTLTSWASIHQRQTHTHTHRKKHCTKNYTGNGRCQSPPQQNSLFEYLNLFKMEVGDRTKKKNVTGNGRELREEKARKFSHIDHLVILLIETCHFVRCFPFLYFCFVLFFLSRSTNAFLLSVRLSVQSTRNNS